MDNPGIPAYGYPITKRGLPQSRAVPDTRHIVLSFRVSDGAVPDGFVRPDVDHWAFGVAGKFIGFTSALLLSFGGRVTHCCSLRAELSGFGHQIGDVDVQQVWTALKEQQQSQLIDVRTMAEWSYVGIPDMNQLGRDPILLEWQSFQLGPDPEFATKLTGELERRSVPKSTDLYFLCRSGVRSLAAAQLMTSIGFSACHNVADGFEGPLDAHLHRGTTAGWKAAGLPWKQG